MTTKTTEIGQKTWGIMKGVMALASQKVEEYTKEGSSGWKNDSWPRSENERNGYYQEFGKDSSSNGWNNTSGQKFNSVSSGSWDDWDSTDGRKDTGNGTASQNGDSWAGWDDNKDDFYHTTSGNNNKPVGYNGNSESEWTGGGFR